MVGVDVKVEPAGKVERVLAQETAGGALIVARAKVVESALGIPLSAREREGLNQGRAALVGHVSPGVIDVFLDDLSRLVRERQDAAEAIGMVEIGRRR